MSTTLDEQIKQLKQAIAEIEAQRTILGDAAVDAALVPSRQRLAELETQVEKPVEVSPEEPIRQRKLVTLLFMDVVGSTEMTQHLDPEDTMEIMDDALRNLAVPVELHSGHVTRFMGDGFMAVFGNPIAREDDPEQAIRAGLDILKVAQVLADELDTQWNIPGFQVRVGINTGLAVLGGYTEAEDTIMGRSVNLAARMESAAPPGGLMISHDTYRHVRGVFDVEPQEPVVAKGFQEPVPVYLVESARQRAFRVPMLGVDGIETRMVGRHTELKYLQDALYTAIEEGEGQLVTVTGEAGVGKSRLLYEFQNWIELLPDDVFFFLGRGRQETQGQPYSLLRDLFAIRFQILDDDTAGEARRKIEAGFGEVIGTEVDRLMRAQIIGQLLGFDFSTSPHLKGVLNDPEQLRNRGQMYLTQYFREFSRDSPILIFLEDIHWGDDSSLDLISQLGERTPQQRLLIVCAARPTLFERRPYWGEGQTYHNRLELRPLSKRESRQLVAEILKMAGKVPTQLRELVVGGAEGNPFYAEELIKMLIEDGVIIVGEETWQVEAHRLAQVDVPSTLAGVLQARLDSLPTHERNVLQQASVVGRLFWDSLVAHIQAETDGDPQLLPLTLTSLRSRELIYRREESAFVDAVEYLFKHDVLREVTYESVLKRLRNIYHGMAADWLISHSGDRIGEHSGLIAEHLLMAGRQDKAYHYFNQAGETALASYANPEAEGHFRQALELSPPDALRADLLSALGEALYRQGHAEEANQIWRQAINLYHELGDSDRMGDVYARLSILLWYSDYLKAWNLCQEGLESMEGAPDSCGYARLLAEAGRTAYFRNVSDQVVPLCRKALEMAERVGDLESQAQANITLAHQNVDINIKESIVLLEEVIVLTEGEGLLRPAARAHHNLGVILGEYLVDLNSAYRYSLRSAEIFRQIGEIEGMMNAMDVVFWVYIGLGELKAVEDKLAEFLRASTVHESRVEDFLQNNREDLLDARGEWIPALDVYRVHLQKSRQRGKFQDIIHYNYNLANTILELNRFGYLDDLTEAERALLENIEIKSKDLQSYFYLTIVCARQGRIAAARDWLTQAHKKPSRYENNLEKELRSRTEFELVLAEGRWAEAVAACESSIEIFRNCGHQWGWARRLIDLGDALVGRNEPGDLERAGETYQQSLDMFTEMGAPGYIKVLEERLGDL